MAEKINIRGVLIDNVDLDDAAKICSEYLDGDRIRAVYTPNSEIIQMCIEDNELLPIINSADLIIPDGIGVIYASKILGTPLKAKCAGYDLGLRMLEIAGERSSSVYFLGGKPGIAEAARDRILEKNPDINFVGCHDGYFDKKGEENDKILSEISALSPDILFVCFGVPAQEKWIFENRDKLGNVKLCLALGGSLDGYSGNVKRAPDIFIKLGLEWFYRLMKEPQRIGRMMKLPKFLFGTIISKFKKA